MLYERLISSVPRAETFYTIEYYILKTMSAEPLRTNFSKLIDHFKSLAGFY